VALCLAGAGLTLHLAVATFTLGWTHTVEKTAWEEDWRVEPDALVLTQARIQGSGAGMDPPPEARRVDGWFVWTPDNPRRERIVLRRAAGVGDWRLCAADRPCTPLGDLLGKDADPVTLWACP
jgi:hypothetical protein